MRSGIVKKIQLIIVLSVIIADFGFSTARVLAKDEGFFASNDILFYDPDSCRSGNGEGTSALVGNDNLEKILRYYVGKGLTLVQAAGIAGNYSRESGFNPAIIQGGKIAPDDYKPVNSVGFGLAQWTFTSRQAPLVALSQSSNRKVTDLSLQLDYSWQELSGNYKRALDNLKQSTEPGNAAYVFHRDYEGSNDSEAQVRQNRGGDAVAIYGQFKTLIPDGSSAGSTAPAGLVCTGNGTASSYVNNFAIYNQNDPQWDKSAYGESTIGLAGCGPAAMAMIITALNKTTVTPAQTAKYGAENGTLYNNGNGGSLHNLHTVIGGNWGLRSTYLGKDVAKVNEGLRSGGLVIISGTGAAPFTKSGHFIVIRAVTADGKWLVGDSNGTDGIENSKKEWDPVYIMSMVGDASYVWLLTK